MKSNGLIWIVAGVLLLCLCIGVVSAVGEIEWQKALGGSGADIPFSVQQTSDGGYILTGYTESSLTGDVGFNHGNRDVWVVKTDPAGTILWQKVMGNTLDQESYRIRQTSDGGYILTGTTDGWVTEDVGFGGWDGTQGSTSLVFDSDGNPHISYCDASANSVIHSWKDFRGWNSQIVDTDPGLSSGQYTSLAYDGSGTLHMSYFNQNDGLKLAHLSGTSWTTETVDPGFNVGGFSSLKIDGNGNPAISYFSYPASSGRLKYAYLSGSTWVIDDVILVSSSSGYTSLAFDSLGYPWISYTVDAATPYPALWLAHKDGSGWHMESVDVGDGYLGTSLAFDSSGIPHVTYVSDTWTLKHAWKSGTMWTIETVDTGGVSSSSLAFDSSGNPHVGYGTDGGLKHAWKSGTTWTIETVAQTDSGWYTSLAFDHDPNPHGNPHISYFDMNIPGGGLTHGLIKHASWLPSVFESDVMVVKLDSTGRGEWQKALGGNNWEDGYDITQTSEGGYILVGRTTSSKSGNVQSTNNGGVDYWVVKLNPAGAIVWESSLGGSDGDEGYGIQQTSDGGYILAGTTTSIDLPLAPNNGGIDIWVVKLNNAGTIEWSTCLGGTGDDFTWRINQTSDGGYITAGWTTSTDIPGTTNHGDRDVYVVKLNSLGAVVWQKVLGGTGFDIAKDVKQTSDGGYIIAASTTSDNSGDVGPNHDYDWDTWVVKLDSLGTIEWQNLLGGNSAEEGESIALTSDQGYIVTGLASSNSNGDVGPSNGGADFWLVKLKATKGSIAVSSNPSSADIYLDGDMSINLGPTPTTINNLAPGRHKVTVGLSGYHTSTKVVPVEAGMTSTVDFTLVPVAASEKETAYANVKATYGIDESKVAVYEPVLLNDGGSTPTLTYIESWAGVQTNLPAYAGYLIFIDDHPDANWEHPCRYFYVKKADLTTITKYDDRIPAANIDLSLWVGRVPDVVGLASFEVAQGVDPDMCTPDTSKRYALLISGGINQANNPKRYYNEIQFMYKTLVNDLGYNKANIKVLMSDGTLSANDHIASYDALNRPVYGNSIADLDGNGVNDVTNSATRANILSTLGTYSSYGQDKHLFIYTTSHGGKTSSGLTPNEANVYLYPWGTGTLTDKDFVRALPKNVGSITIMMEQCNSGGFIDDVITNYNTVVGPTGLVTTRMITTAATGEQVSNANDFSYPWISGVAKHDSNGVMTFADVAPTFDGSVSMVEAYTYAYAIDPSQRAGLETPQFSDYAAGTGSTNFLYTCAATQPTITVTSPTAGTIFTYGSTPAAAIPVTWSTTGLTSATNVKVELYKDSMGWVAPIKSTNSATANSIGTAWSVPATLGDGPGSDYFVRISTTGTTAASQVIGDSPKFTINGVTAQTAPATLLVRTQYPAGTSKTGAEIYLSLRDPPTPPVEGGRTYLQTDYTFPDPAGLFPIRSSTYYTVGIAGLVDTSTTPATHYYPDSATVLILPGANTQTFVLNRIPPTEVGNTPYGSISVTSTPEGATVFIDGSSVVDKTPTLPHQVRSMQEDGVTPFEHTVRVELAGHMSQEKTVTVPDNTPVNVDFVLTKTPDVPAKVLIVPQPLNIGRPGYFAAFVKLPNQYKAADVIAASVSCNDAPALKLVRLKLFPHIFVAIFKRQDLVGVSSGDKVPFTVIGEIRQSDGNRIFTGTNYIKVINIKVTTKEPCDDLMTLPDTWVFTRFNPGI